jgi:hypothetical protein
VAVSEPVFPFLAVTAPLRSSFVPTLLRGIFTAAYEVPPSAMNSASRAMWCLRA